MKKLHWHIRVTSYEKDIDLAHRADPLVISAEFSPDLTEELLIANAKDNVELMIKYLIKKRHG